MNPMTDPFALFGLPERFEIDRAELERRYLAMSRELHPDRHVNASPRERLLSVERTTNLNEAYKTLRDDFRRAEHLLLCRGIDTTEQNEDHRATVDGQLLMEVLELREALAQACASSDAVKINELAVDVRGRTDRAWTELRALFQKLDAGDPAPLRSIATGMTSLRYYRRFLEEVAVIEDA